MFGKRLLGQRMRTGLLRQEDEENGEENEGITDDINRLEEIKDEMSGMLDECDSILRKYRKYGSLYERAERYWMAHIEGALIHGGRWLGGSMHRMEDTIKELEDLKEGKEVD